MADQTVHLALPYLAPSQALSLRAPLINFDGLSRVRQAKLQAEVAEHNYRGRALGLVDRLGTAYSQALLVRSAVALADREVASTQSQLSRAQNRFQRGEGTRTEIAQTTAALESARFRQLDTRREQVLVEQVGRLRGDRLHEGEAAANELDLLGLHGDGHCYDCIQNPFWNFFFPIP